MLHLNEMKQRTILLSYNIITCTLPNHSRMIYINSAGIGRTGTYIALDRLMEQGETSGKVCVFQTVKEMREQRVSMVQTVVCIHLKTTPHQRQKSYTNFPDEAPTSSGIKWVYFMLIVTQAVGSFQHSRVRFLNYELKQWG